MKLLSPILSSLFFAAPNTHHSKHHQWYFIDGSNTMGHKGTPRDRETIAEKLKPIEQASSDLSVILVWDGLKGQSETIVVDSEHTNSRRSDFQIVALAEGMSADDYILESLQELKDSHNAGQSSVQVVTADRELRRQVLRLKPVAKGVINPVVFWKRYRPRLSGMKSDYKNEPKDPEAML